MGLGRGRIIYEFYRSPPNNAPLESLAPQASLTSVPPPLENEPVPRLGKRGV